jgi:hypothetical protein
VNVNKIRLKDLTDTKRPSDFSKEKLKCCLSSGKGFSLFDNSTFDETKSKKFSTLIIYNFYEYAIFWSETEESPVWYEFFNDQLVSEIKQMPINGFDEMIAQTDEGRLWKFPIDNEQGKHLSL